MSLLEDLKKAVIDMDSDKSKELTQSGLDEGMDAEELLNKALIPAMDIGGEEAVNLEL